MRVLLILALLLPPAAHAAEPLGRLFFTPEQRVQLDTLRIRKVVAVQTKEEPPPEIITYSGIVRRSDGKATVWVNSKALSEADLRDQPSISGRIGRNGQILLEAGGGKMRLKVGQSAELLSGRVDEAYSAQRTTSVPVAKPNPKTDTNLPAKPAADTPASRPAAKQSGEEPVQPADREAILLRERISDAPAK